MVRKSEISEEQKRLNRVSRLLTLIEENAKAATPGPWILTHNHVVKLEYQKGANGKVTDKSFDIACEPWMQHQAVYGVNPQKHFSNNMRHITTCEPRTMLQLVEDVRAILGIQKPSP